MRMYPPIIIWWAARNRRNIPCTEPANGPGMKKYSRYPDSMTELIEFLKAVQKGGGIGGGTIENPEYCRSEKED